MSGDSKEQPNIFYTKAAPLLTAECLLQEGKVKSLYRMADEPEKVYMHFLCTKCYFLTSLNYFPH